MKKILSFIFPLFSLLFFVTSLGWTRGLEDARAALTAANDRNYDKAIELYTKAISSGDLSQENLSKVYSNCCNAWNAKGNHDRAISDCTKAIEINPENASAYHNRGNAWNDMGKLDKAISDYTKAIKIEPENAKSYSNRGNVWNAKGLYDQAVSDCTKAIEINPRNPLFYSNRGNAWNSRGNHSKAISDCLKAIEINSKFALGYNNLGVAYEGLGKHKEAIEAYRHAIRIKPDFVRAHFNLGIGYLKLGNKEAALEQYEILRSLDKEQAAVLLNLIKNRKTIVPLAAFSFRQAWRRADDDYATEKLSVLFREDRVDICYKFTRVRFAVG